MDYKKTAEEILEKIGGKGNVSFATYCMTRLRISYKDKGLINDEAVKKIPDIVGTKFVGNQYQVILGPAVANVYDALCEIAGFEKTGMIEENLDEEISLKEKFSVKSVVNNVMDVISGCVTPMLPIITISGLLKMIVAFLGPSMLNLLPDSSDFMRLLTFVGDAGFYFFPVFAAYGAAKKFNTNIPIALLFAVIMLSNGYIGIVNEGAKFTVYGIPMALVSYGSSFIPIVLTVWIMSYVDRWLQKVIPNSLKAMAYPLLLTLIILPIELCILGPLGTWIGQAIATVIVALHNVVGPLAIALVGAFWPMLIATGMHQGLIAVALTYIGMNGFDDSILVGAVVSNYPMIAIALANILKSKTAEERSAGTTGFLTLALGGISEPTIFGVILRYKRAILYMLAGGFAGGFFAGLMKATVYFVPSGNALVFLGFAGERASSLPMGIVSCLIAFAVSFALCMIFGFEDKKKEA